MIRGWRDVLQALGLFAMAAAVIGVAVSMGPPWSLFLVLAACLAAFLWFLSILGGLT